MLPKALPKFDELPNFHNFTGCAWDVWGQDDELGTINLLTEEVVREAASEIKTGKTVCLNWPINFPNKPLFGRQSPQHRLVVSPIVPTVNDDILHINTQSGTQWDGMRHFGILKHGVFYNNTSPDCLQKGELVISDPGKIDLTTVRYGIHNWAQHGICSRGVFLDIVRYYTESGSALPYDPWTAHAVPLSVVEDCAKRQGVTFRKGDILLLRMGFTQRFNNASQAERDALGDKPETFAGLEQSEEIKRFLWDNHFAAVASDVPTIERWPPPKGVDFLHETLLSLWGMPIGEMFDLEALSTHCAQTGRYSFFFTSWPLNVLGGVASPPNAAAYF